MSKRRSLARSTLLPLCLMALAIPRLSFLAHAAGVPLFQDGRYALDPANTGQSLVFSPKGNHLLVAEPKGLALVDSGTWAIRARLSLPSPTFAVSPSGTLVAALGRGKEFQQLLVLWDLRTGKEERLPAPGVVDGDSPLLLFSGEDRLAIATGKMVEILELPKANVLFKAVNPVPSQDRRLAQTSKFIAFGQGPERVAIHDARTGARLHLLTFKPQGDNEVQIHDLQFSPDGAWLAVASTAGLALYDSSTFAAGKFQYPSKTAKSQEDTEVSAFAWHPSSSSLALVLNNQLLSVHIHTGDKRTIASQFLAAPRLPAQGNRGANHSLSETRSLHYDPSGKQLALRGDGLCVIDAESGRARICSRGTSRAVQPAVSADLRYFVGAGADHDDLLVHVLSNTGPNQGTPLALRKGETRAAFEFPDGEPKPGEPPLALFHGALLQLASGQVLQEGPLPAPFHGKQKLAARIGSNTKTQGRSLELLDLYTGKVRLVTKPLPKGTTLSDQRAKPLFSEGGEFIGAYGSTQKESRYYVYATKDGSLRGSVPLPALSHPSIHLSPDGALVVVDDLQKDPSSRSIKVLQAFDTKTGKQKLRFEALTGSAAPIPLYFDDKRKRILASLPSGISVLDPSAGREVKKLPYTSLSSLGPDGDHLVVQGRQGVCVFDLRQDQCTQVLQGAKRSLRFVFSPDTGAVAASAGIGGDEFEIQVWDTKTGALLRTLGQEDGIGEFAALRFVSPSVLAYYFDELCYVSIKTSQRKPICLRTAAKGMQVAVVSGDGSYDGDREALSTTLYRQEGPLHLAPLVPIVDVVSLKRPGLLKEFFGSP